MKFVNLLSYTMVFAATGLAVPTPENIFEAVSGAFTECNAPRNAQTETNCWGDAYHKCVALQDQAICVAQCWKQPAGDCSSSCTLQIQRDCDFACSTISTCDECTTTYLRQDGVDEEQALDFCSSEGDRYCGCLTL